MGAPVLFRHRSSLEHDNGLHPEQPRRITAVLEAVAADDRLAIELRESDPAPIEKITAVHDPALVEMVQRLCAAGGGYIDADTAVSEKSFEAALRGAGGTLAMAELLVAGQAPAGFSVHRPPGHHAETSRAMGFCLFNHVAIAAQHARDELGLERVAIVDFDVHHGNGTQEIFWERPDVHFCSAHQYPFYPGSGGEHEAGGGAGRGFTLNFPMPAGAGDDEFASAIGVGWAQAMVEFEPELILVSAGFDAHAADPLASCLMTDEGFGALGREIRLVASAHGAPVGVVLEGGYDLGALGRSFTAFARELIG